jgi:glucose/arabinose dehydrogenase
LLAYKYQGPHLANPVNIDPRAALQNPDNDGTLAAYHPRSVVLGPDGYLYVSLLGKVGAEAGRPVCGGSIARFDPVKLLYKDTVISNPSDCALNKNDLHRPEGLGFDPKGNLYVTSFRATPNPSDIDRILIIPEKNLKKNGDEKADISLPLDRIDLWRFADGGPRAFAQTLLFGPDGHLFAPIELRDLATGRTLGGEVRRYNLETKAFWTFVSAAGRDLFSPVYMTFGKTNPATLAYDDEDDRE